MLRVQLLGLAAYHGKLSPDLAVCLIQSFTRSTGHNPSYFSTLAALLKTGGWSDLSPLLLEHSRP